MSFASSQVPASAPDLPSIAAETRDCALFARNATAKIARAPNMLGLNARIDAARVGQPGAGFALVAEEMRKVAPQIDTIAQSLGESLARRLAGLEAMVTALSTAASGQRLVDLAFTAIDILGRNLYGCSCDVRWWASDADLVAALADPSPEAVAHAARRLGVILDAYTVYADIWLLRMDGTVLCNGRPADYPVAGQVERAPWLEAAWQIRDGAGFVAGDVAPSVLLRGRRMGRALGLVMTRFDRAPQSQAVLDSLPLGPGLLSAAIVDDRGLVLAARGAKLAPGTRLDLPQTREGVIQAGERRIAHHRTPGFETWAGKGWQRGAFLRAP